jgi:hypothetical protein
MQMRPAVQIKSMVKAMTDVVLPAIDPANKLAQEQGRLVVGLLSLMAQQLPLQFRFDCDDLARQLELSVELKKAAGSMPEAQALLEEMSRAAATAARTLEQARVAPEQLEQALRELRAATSQVVRGVYGGADEATAERVQRLVLAAAKEQLLRDRSWVLMQGWEPDPAAVPKIQELLQVSG